VHIPGSCTLLPDQHNHFCKTMSRRAYIHSDLKMAHYTRSDSLYKSIYSDFIKKPRSLDSSTSSRLGLSRRCSNFWLCKNCVRFFGLFLLRRPPSSTCNRGRRLCLQLFQSLSSQLVTLPLGLLKSLLGLPSSSFDSSILTLLLSL
jgi:hypothetical protein